MKLSKFFKSIFKKDSNKNGDKAQLESALTEKYLPGKVLGSGSFAIVKKVTRKADSQEFACKIIDRIKLKGIIAHDLSP